MAKIRLSFILRDRRGRYLKPTQYARARSVAFFYGKKRIAFEKLLKKSSLDKQKEVARLATKAGNLLLAEKQEKKKKFPLRIKTITRKVFAAETVGTPRQPVRYNRNLHLKVKIYKHDEILFSPQTLKDVLIMLRPIHFAALLKRFNELLPRQRRFIFRILYTIQSHYGTIEKGIGSIRFEAQTEEELKFFLKKLRHKIRLRFNHEREGYFAQLLPETRYAFTGFTIENIDRVGRELAGQTLERRLKQWSNLKKKNSKARSDSIRLNKRIGKGKAPSRR